MRTIISTFFAAAILSLVARAPQAEPFVPDAPVMAQTNGYCVDQQVGGSQIRLDTGIVYKAADDWLGRRDSLRMDVAYPLPDQDSLVYYPLVLFVHGGGLHSGDRKLYTPSCSLYAMRGYVAATIDYRLGWDLGSGVLACDGDTATLRQAIERAVEDLRTACRVLSAGRALLGIDTSLVFLFGASAGGFISLTTAFSDNGTIGATGQFLHVKGIVNCWGGMMDTSLLTTSSALPCLLFHTSNDPVSPFESGPLYRCTAPVRFPTAFGSRTIASRLSALGACYRLYYNHEATHGFTDLSLIDPVSVAFMKDVLCNRCASGEYMYGSSETIQNTVAGRPLSRRKGPGVLIFERSFGHLLIQDRALNTYDLRGTRVNSGLKKVNEAIKQLRP
jgi:acetyl esterase/lipase